MANAVKSAVAASIVALIASSYLSQRFKPGAASARPVVAQQAPGAVLVTPPPKNSANVILDQSPDGHYYARVEARGVTTRMVVDTGATYVSLTADDAVALGFNLSPSDFKIPSSTANGVAWLAPVRLDMVRIDGILVYDVDALVAKPGAQNVSLLGMSYLKKLASYQAEQGRLILRQ
jgi:aspartyl protease family protein